MTQAEELDMLRRQVADLMDRVRQLEARPTQPVYMPIGAPMPQPFVPAAVPLRGPTYSPSFWPVTTCGDGGTAGEH